MKQFKSIVILTGAGISAESGIQTFRGENGLWEKVRIEEVATPEAFYANPEKVHQFYNQRRRELLSNKIKPNPAHMALAKLEKEFEGSVVIITQNIDNLHERGGSSNIIHMHGELLKMRCDKSSQTFSIESDLSTSSVCQCCNEKGNLRPHIVWFGEMPFFMEQIQLVLTNCDLFLSIGTSGNVYPAAMFVEIVKQNRSTYAVEFDLETTNTSDFFDELITGNAAQEVPRYVDQLLMK